MHLSKIYADKIKVRRESDNANDRAIAIDMFERYVRAFNLSGESIMCGFPIATNVRRVLS